MARAVSSSVTGNRNTPTYFSLHNRKPVTFTLQLFVRHGANNKGPMVVCSALKAVSRPCSNICEGSNMVLCESEIFGSNDWPIVFRYDGKP